MTTTQTLIKVTVPLFLLSGMSKKDDKFVATVVSHEGKDLVISVEGTEAKVSVDKQKNFFKKGIKLVFDGNGELTGIDGEGEIYQPSKTERVSAAPAPRSTGSNEYREAKLF